MKKGTISEVRDYYLEKDKNILLDASKEFYGMPSGNKNTIFTTIQSVGNLFYEWLFYDYKLNNNKTMLEDFYKTNPFHLSSQELSVYKDLQDNEYGLYKVLQLKFGEGLSLENIISHKKYFVEEFSGTLGVNTGDLITGRIGKVDDHYELVGSDPFVLPFSFGELFLKLMKTTKEKFDPKFVRILISR